MIRVIQLGFYASLLCMGSAAAETDEQLAELERLLEERAEEASGIVLAETVEMADVTNAPVAVVVDSPAADAALQEAQQRIATLEQFVADRDAIIVELSNQNDPAPDSVDVDALQADNQKLKEQLSAAIHERDQIRLDFNRLFEGGEFAQPAEGSEAVVAEKERLAERVSSLEKQLSQLTEHLSDVVEEKNTLAEQLKEAATNPEDADSDRAGLEEKLSEMRDTVATMESSLAASEAARERLVAELDEQRSVLEKRLQTLTSENESLVLDVAQAQRARVELEAQLEKQPAVMSEDEMSQELSSLRELDASRRVAMDELMLKLGGLRDVVTERDKEVELLRAEVSELKGKLDDAMQQIEDKDSFTNNLRGEIKTLSETIHTLQSRIDEQFDEFSQLQKYAKVKEDELLKVQDRFETLRNKHANVMRNHEDLLDANQVLDAELGKLRTILGQRDEENQSLQREMADSLQVEKRRQRLLDETLARLARVEESETKLLSEKSELEGLTEALRQERNGLSSKVQSLEQQIASLQQEKNAVTDAVQSLQKSLAKREQALEEKIIESESLARANRDLEAKISEVRSEADSLRAQLSRMQADHAASQDQLASLQAEVEKIRLVDATRKRTLDETLEKLAVAEQEKGNLEVQLASVDARLQEMTESQKQEILSLQAKNNTLEKELLKMEQDLALALEGAYSTSGSSTNEMDLAAQLVALEARNAALAGEMAQLRATAEANGNGALAADGVALEDNADYTNLKLALEASQREVQQLQDALLARSTAETGGSGNEVAVLLEQLENQRKLAMEATAEVEGLAAALAVAESELNHLAEVQGQGQGTEAQASARVTALSAELAATQAKLSRALAGNAEGEAAVNVRETDLYQELEQNNTILRETLEQAQSDRERLKQEVQQLGEQIAQIASSKEEAEGELASALAREDEYRELIDRLVPEVRSLEEQVTELRRMREAMSARLLQREEDVSSLQMELEKREHRLARAERVADVLEEARSEVEQAQRKQRLNMHYNMASVYAREGRFEEAEYEYLQAIRLDPSDADVHYNLGILYDDQLEQPEKALLHYRRYLQLNPHGEDADRVRNWVMRLEMREER